MRMHTESKNFKLIIHENELTDDKITNKWILILLSRCFIYYLRISLYQAILQVKEIIEKVGLLG